MYLPCLLFFAATVASSQIIPQTNLSAVNAASLETPISPGAIVSIFLSGTFNPSFPPPERLSVVLDPAGGARVEIPVVVRINNTQLNAVLPANAPLGRSVLRVLRDSQDFLATTVDITPSAPAIFTASHDGMGPAATTPPNRLTTAFTPACDVTL